MIRINLLPVREARRRAGRRQIALIMGAVVGLALLICVGLHVTVVATLASERTALEGAQGERAKLQTALDKISSFRKQAESIESKLAVIEKLETSRSGPVRILDEIATRLPERVWLTRLRLAGDRLELEGLSLDNEIIAAFMTGLERSDFLTGVELAETRLQTVSGVKVNAFKISCRRTSGGRAKKADSSANLRDTATRG